MSERFMVDNCGTLIDMESRTTYDYVSEVCPLLNEQDERIKELEKALNNFKPIIFKNDGEDLILYSNGDLE